MGEKNKPAVIQSNGSGAPDQVQKLKSTVLQLESTLSKRNKEIASLKKQTGESGGKKQVFVFIIFVCQSTSPSFSTSSRVTLLSWPSLWKRPALKTKAKIHLFV